VPFSNNINSKTIYEFATEYSNKGEGYTTEIYSHISEKI
jgi:hypothetical protein